MSDNEQLLELPLLFRDLVKHMSDEWKRRSNTDLTMSQYRMLMILNKDGAMKAIELAEQLCVTPGAITGMADKMEEYGWVTRQRNLEDRRVILIHLTEAGRELVKLLKVRQKETTDALFEVLPAEDIAHLHRIFTKLIEGMGRMKEE